MMLYIIEKKVVGTLITWLVQRRGIDEKENN